MGIVAEEWRPVAKSSEARRYEVTAAGEVAVLVNGRRKQLRPCVDRYGYFAVSIETPSGRVSTRVHRLVADAFFPEGVGDWHVNHKDGNKLNNHLENLELVTLQENHAHASRTGLRNHLRRLTIDQANEIKRLLKAGFSQTELARRFGVSQPVVSDIKRGRSYKQ